MPSSSNKKPASDKSASGKKPDLPQADDGVKYDEESLWFDEDDFGFDVEDFVGDFGFDEGPAVGDCIEVNTSNLPSYHHAVATRPRALETCWQGRQTLTCCKGHKSLDINAPVCQNESQFFKKLCGHRRCNDCTITWEAGRYDEHGAGFDVKRTYSIRKYPGARAMREVMRQEGERTNKKQRSKQEAEDRVRDWV